MEGTPCLEGGYDTSPLAHRTDHPPLVVFLPGPTIWLLGTSVAAINARVAARAGATLTSLESLAADPSTRALVVPHDVLIETSLFADPPGDGGVTVVTAGQGSTTAAMPVGTARDARRAAWTILRRTARPTDGWVARRFNRPISRIVSFVSLSCGLRPAHASVLTLLVGLATAAIALQPGWVPFVAAGILFQAASILDGVDGEMARATLTESVGGARLDTIVDHVTYVSCLIGFIGGWIREGAGAQAAVGAGAVALALVLSLARGRRFVARHGADASFVFIDRSVRRAARRTDRLPLRAAPAVFSLMRRDAFAVVFLAIAVIGQRALVPLLVAVGIAFANLTLSFYHRELAEAAFAERLAVE